MTKISKKSAYPVKIPVRKDYFVGTDSENNGKTVNFDFESTAKLINELNGTPILNYIFKTDNNIPLAVLTEGVFLSEGNETTVSNISKLYINKKNFHEEDMSDLFRFIAVNREVFIMKLRNSSNLANGVYFRITDATEFENHFILDVAIELSNTAVPELVNFNVYFFDFELNSSNLAITIPEFNKIVTQTGYTSTETTITFNPFWTWLIKNVSYENSASVVKTIATATTGKKRIDVFVLNTSNTFETISGAETTGSPVKPQIPADTLEVTFCIVGDPGIETVEPIDLSAYATTQYVDDKDDLKVDKVTGKSLIADSEITRLSTVTNFDNSVNTTALATKVDKVANKSLIADSEITRLATLTNYTHPTNHPPSIITQDASNRFVTDAEKATWNAKQSALGYTAENSANKNIANGYAGLGSDGKLISSQLPSITISDTFVTASQAAMLALTSAETGDVAVRTDLNKSFILKGTNYSVLTDWQELLTPTSAVTTVFGRNGAVGAQTGDYNAEQITETVTRVFQTPTQKANNDATSSIQTQLNSKQATITAGTTSQYYRGDKTFQTLDKTAVGLANVDNTSDDNKPISTLTQTALNLKENTSNKQNSLTADGTGVKFPTVDAVNAGLALKASLTGAIFTGQVEAFSSLGFKTNGNLNITSNGAGLVAPNSGNISFLTNNASDPRWVSNVPINATSFVNSSAPATNALLANGTTLAVAPQTGGTGYIQNQNASAQSANMWINGIGKFSQIILDANTIEEYSSNSDTGEIAINYRGYLGGTTRFRNFNVYNGKNSPILQIVGSTGAATFASSVTASNGQLIGGTLTSGYIPKATGANSLGNSLIQESGNNIGINVAPTNGSATENLEMVNGTTFSSRTLVPQLYISSNAVGQAYTPTYKVDGYATQYVSQGFDGTHLWTTATSGTAGSPITWEPRMKITNGGNVGIGTTNPQSIFHINSSGNTEHIIDAPLGSSILTMTASAGGSGIIAYKNRLRLGTVTGYAAAGFGDQVNINSNGNVIIGTTTDDGVNKLQVNGGGRFIGVGELTVEGTNTNVLGVINLKGTSVEATNYVVRQGVVGVSNGGFSLRDETNTANRFAISPTGVVGIMNLSGTGTRTVVADASGNLSAVSNIDYRNYKVYTALLTQTGTNAPVATVLENTLGGSVVWSRSSAGTYLGTLNGAFTFEKTYVTTDIGETLAAYGENVNIYKNISLNAIGLLTVKPNSQVDDVLKKTTIEIRVYN